MRRNKSLWLAGIILAGVALSFPVLAEPQPGSACTSANEVMHVGGPENPDKGYLVVCDGSTWRTVTEWETATGDSLFKVGYDSGTCTATKEGRLRYNSGADEWNYCDGGAWVPFEQAASGGCTPDPACPNVGNTCSGDGSGGGNPKFAGCICYYDTNSADAGTCKALYVTQANQSTSAQWKTSTGSNDIATDSLEDGKINDSQVADSATFQAFKICKDLTAGGYGDWYLPSDAELNLLWRNSASIGGFTANRYWSSREVNINAGWIHSFSDGFQDFFNKTSWYYVRCVRRD